jgi:hypothetical protein
MDEQPDDIARWAEGLSPDGSPGVMSQKMREYLGDAGYEKAMAQSEAVSALYLQKNSLTNSILFLILVYGTIYGLLGFVASVALLIKFIF